jgi:protein tyrosine phosphatase
LIVEVWRHLTVAVCRYADILAYDDTRVHLRNPEDGQDYINANYVTYPNHDDPFLFICSQGPTTQTLADHWDMLWEQQIGVRSGLACLYGRL